MLVASAAMMLAALAALAAPAAPAAPVAPPAAPAAPAVPVVYAYNAASHSPGVALHSGSGGLCRELLLTFPNHCLY